MKHWIIAVILCVGLGAVLGLSDPHLLGINLGFAFGTLFWFFLLIWIIGLIAKGINRPLSKKMSIRVFYVLLIFSLFSMVNFIGRNNKNLRTNSFVNNCVSKLKAQIKDNPSLLDYDLKSYCQCASEKTNKLTLADTADLSDPNSAAFIELYGPCWETAKIKDTLKGLDKVMGPDTIIVINLSGHIQVKTKVNGIETFMIFDSGASDVFISRDFLDQFSAGQVEYLDKYSFYNMANGTQIKAQLAKVQQFEIGKFKLQDVEVAVAEEMVSPLLGKSILDQFSSWTINSENQLILVP